MWNLLRIRGSLRSIRCRSMIVAVIILASMIIPMGFASDDAIVVQSVSSLEVCSHPSWPTYTITIPHSIAGTIVIDYAIGREFFRREVPVGPAPDHSSIAVLIRVFSSATFNVSFVTVRLECSPDDSTDSAVHFVFPDYRLDLINNSQIRSFSSRELQPGWPLSIVAGVFDPELTDEVNHDALVERLWRSRPGPIELQESGHLVPFAIWAEFIARP